MSLILSNGSLLLRTLRTLFLRMRSQQAEIAATVHFTANRLFEDSEDKPSELEVLGKVMQWKQKRLPPLNETEVALAIRNLSMLGC